MASEHVVSLPNDIVNEVVLSMDDSQHSLMAVALVSKAFVYSSRNILFSNIEVKNASRLQQLASLLDSTHCTIPWAIDTLVLILQDCSKLKPTGQRIVCKLSGAINHMLTYFRVRISSTLVTAWAINNYPGWVTEYYTPSTLRWARMTNWWALRELTIRGNHSRIEDLAKALSHLTLLESLAVSTMW
ncbi:hypothetical protein EST38_g12381 [Candolleomyces aberdarensis]|uniref:F-box domain-containing protein n=1 Tax=Candolleomyces aberdarensis TaxID=2316362 RepID=A0A4Q2D3U7_9AGAR|nr:hypothetical protein EST38_g12381 [Candolleomyces aberdarensis]